MCLSHNPNPESRLAAQRILRLEDATEAAALQAWVPIRYGQITGGRFRGQLHALTLPGIELFREQYNQDVCKVGALPAGQCTLSFVEQGHTRSRFSQFVAAGETQSFFQPQRHEFDIVVPAGIQTTYVHLDSDALLGELARLNAPLAERLVACESLQSMRVTGKAQLKNAMQAIQSFFNLDCAGRADPHALRRILLEHLALALNAIGEPRCGSEPNLHGRRRACFIARRAREFMEAEMQRGVTPRLGNICTQVGVSERTLRAAFVDQFGHPPAVFIRLMRMNGIRAELLDSSPNTTVTEIATRWGFLQLGRFARDYRALFGESPSTTLKRAHLG